MNLKSVIFNLTADISFYIKNFNLLFFVLHIDQIEPNKNIVLLCHSSITVTFVLKYHLKFDLAENELFNTIFNVLSQVTMKCLFLCVILTWLGLDKNHCNTHAIHFQRLLYFFWNHLLHYLNYYQFPNKQKVIHKNII